MSRMLHCKARMTLVTAMAMGIGTAQAHQMLYDQDGYKLAVGMSEIDRSFSSAGTPMLISPTAAHTC